MIKPHWGHIPEHDGRTQRAVPQSGPAYSGDRYRRDRAQGVGPGQARPHGRGAGPPADALTVLAGDIVARACKAHRSTPEPRPDLDRISRCRARPRYRDCAALRQQSLGRIPSRSGREIAAGAPGASGQRRRGAGSRHHCRPWSGGRLDAGAGIGSAVFPDGWLAPHLQLAQHPLHNGETYNKYAGNKACNGTERRSGTGTSLGRSRPSSRCCITMWRTWAAATRGTSPSISHETSGSPRTTTASQAASISGTRPSGTTLTHLRAGTPPYERSCLSKFCRGNIRKTQWLDVRGRGKDPFSRRGTRRRFGLASRCTPLALEANTT